MQLYPYQPISPLMQAHIESIYVLERRQEDPSVNYITFPKLGDLVSVYVGATTNVDRDQIIISHQRGAGLESRIVGGFAKGVQVIYRGSIREITTIFKPLSINYFLRSALSDYAKGPFDRFEPYPDHYIQMALILKKNSPVEMASAMENYWHSKFRTFSHPYLPQIIQDIISNTGETESIAHYAEKYGVSRQAIHGQFNRYLGKSFSEFRKLARFTNAMKTENTEGKRILSSLSAIAAYFDQSHMIRDFKSITGNTPKVFFSKISKIQNGQANWMFL